MSKSEFQEELNALISEIAILKTKISDDELKTAVLSIVQKARRELKAVSARQEQSAEKEILHA